MNAESAGRISHQNERQILTSPGNKVWMVPWEHACTEGNRSKVWVPVKAKTAYPHIIILDLLYSCIYYYIVLCRWKWIFLGDRRDDKD